MLEKFDLPSVNHLAATIKLQEVWKAIDVPSCPLALDPYKANIYSNHDLRASNNREFNDTARLKLSKSSFNVDAARIWNQAPLDIKHSTCLSEAKRRIKIYTKTLPIWFHIPHSDFTFEFRILI